MAAPGKGGWVVGEGEKPDKWSKMGGGGGAVAGERDRKGDLKSAAEECLGKH